jgi:protein-S-isoprenylcysteine O-methyltransferase Ste14
MLLGAAGLKIGPYNTPVFIQWISWVLLMIGVFISILSMHKLADDLISGLPEDNLNCLQTDGIFRISRNPLYLGFFMIVAASMISVPNPINIVCGIVGIFIHHKIVLAEEEYLIKTKGDIYTAYMKQVRRYL